MKLPPTSKARINFLLYFVNIKAKQKQKQNRPGRNLHTNRLQLQKLLENIIPSRSLPYVYSISKLKKRGVQSFLNIYCPISKIIYDQTDRYSSSKKHRLFLLVLRLSQSAETDFRLSVLFQYYCLLNTYRLSFFVIFPFLLSIPPSPKKKNKTK